MTPAPPTPADDGRGLLPEARSALGPSARFRKALLDAARDECIRRFDYPVERYWQGEIGQRQHIERDAESTAGEKRFKSIFLAGWKAGMAEAKRHVGGAKE